MNNPNDSVDTKLKFDKSDGMYDIEFNEEGDFSLTDTLDTALLVSLFLNQRASADQVPNSYLRGGWWGNLFLNPKMGSNLWLLNQTVNNSATLNAAITYVEASLQWLLDFGYADDISVTGSNNRGKLTLKASIFKNGSKITEKAYDLWQNTLKEIEA